MALSKKERSKTIYSRLDDAFPNVGTFLVHETPFQLLVAVILSAQCTDERINKVTPALFKAYPTCDTMAAASLASITNLIKSVTYFNSKATHIKLMSQMLCDTYGATVPQTLKDLVCLPGVGRKTANVVLGQAFDIPGITVDTHVGRLCRRLGFTKQSDAVKVETDLMKLWPKEHWNTYSSILILHGRTTCQSRKPNCSMCILADLCPKIGLSNTASRKK